MSDTLSFPGIGLEFNINPVAFHIGDLWSVKWYGILFALAMLAGLIYVSRRIRTFGLDAERTMDVLLGSIVGGVIGARLYYVAFSGDTYDFLRILRVWEGGLAIYGGVIGALLAGVLMCRIRKVKLRPVMDVGLTALILGQAIGRWGNFFNMEAFGSNTTAPWGMTSATIQRYLAYHQASLEAVGILVDPSMPVHPTFLYESIWCLAGFILLALYTKHRIFDGELSLMYLAWYGLGRFFIEGLRTDSLMLGRLRVSQLLALVCVLFAAFAWGIIRSRIKREGDRDFLKLYVDTPEGQAVLAGTFYKTDKVEAASEQAEKSAENPHQETQTPPVTSDTTQAAAEKQDAD